MPDDESSGSTLVSTIIPAYDRPDRLRGAIESVNEQTYSPLELVVVDDCSPTDLASAVADAPTEDIETVQYVRHERNRGANAARNTGIEASSGEFVAFLDDDDRWRPEKIERQVAAVQAMGPDCGVVFTGIENVDSQGQTTNVREPTTRGTATHELLCGASLNPFSTVLVRRSAIDDAGCLDEEFPSWQDRDWYIRLSTVCQFETVSEPLVVGIQHDADQISDNYEAKRDVSYPRIVEKHLSLAEEYGAVCKRRFLSNQRRALGGAALQNGFYVEGVRHLVRALAYYPLNVDAYVLLVSSLAGRYTYGPARKLKRAYNRKMSESRQSRAGTRSGSPPSK